MYCSIKKTLTTLFTLVTVTSCAVLHHVQVGEINDHQKFNLKPFEVKVSETGVDFEDVGDITKSLSRSKAVKEQIDNVMAIIQLFQQGPRTGVPVFNESYAKNIAKDLYKECPSGRITGVVSIREMRKYPVISGEIIKIKGFCMTPKNTADVTPTEKKPSKTKKS